MRDVEHLFSVYSSFDYSVKRLLFPRIYKPLGYARCKLSFGTGTEVSKPMKRRAPPSSSRWQLPPSDVGCQAFYDLDTPLASQLAGVRQIPSS